MEEDSTISASEAIPASRNRSRTRYPVQVALEMSSPPTGLDTHVSVTVFSMGSKRCRSSNVKVTSLSTMPWMRNRQSARDTWGTLRAVSMR